MKKQKQKIKILLGGALVFGAVFIVTTAIKAGVSDNVSGWLWGGSEQLADGTISGNETGVGWISMNNLNPGAGGAVSYGVDMPTTSGQITGYAYSENVGYIDFNPHAGCPGSPKYAGACDAYPAAPSQDATRNADNSITGWARFVEISKAKAVGNSGGWQGWIKFSGPNYTASIDPATKKMTGYAWSDELGMLSFSGNNSGTRESYGPTLPPPPSVTLSSNPATITVGSTDFVSQNIALSWTVSDATSCTKSGGNWSGSINNPTTGTDSAVSQTSSTVTYRLDCTGLGGTASATVTVTTGCVIKTCGSNVCASTFDANGLLNNSKCVAATNCSVDADCQPKNINGWKEVTP